jgi:hypothetical protein
MTGKLTTKAPRHQGMQMGTWKLCQFFFVPLGGKNCFGNRVFQRPADVAKGSITKGPG